jgi:DnaJ-class molecular chaperone
VLKSEGLPQFDDPQLKGDLVVHFDIKFPEYIPKNLRDKIADIFDEVHEYEQNQHDACK